MADFKFENYSAKVIADLDSTTIAWLREASNEIASHAKRNCKMDGEGEAKQLKGSYEGKVDEAAGIAYVGSPLEAAFWEEFGTGEYAAVAKNGGKRGRQGWWVYVEGGSGYKGKTKTYYSQAEAEAAAKRISIAYHVKAVATKGRQPSATLENAFNAIIPKAIKALEAKLKGID